MNSSYRTFFKSFYIIRILALLITIMIGYNTLFWYQGGQRVIGISGSLFWSKILFELIFYLCGEFRWSPEGPVRQIHSPHLHVGTPGIFSDLLRSVEMLKRERGGAESNGKLSHLFIPSKPAHICSWVCSGRPAFGQNYNLGSCVCGEKPALWQNTLMMMMMMILICVGLRV